MVRPIPVKLIVAVALIAGMVVMAFSMTHGPGSGGSATADLSSEDRAWLRERLARPKMPLPKPRQPEVLLLWEAPIDAPKVRPVVSLVDHPEGVQGVYGMDVANSDAIGIPLHIENLARSLPTRGAWIVVLDRYGRKTGATPIISPDTVRQAFALAQGKRTDLEGSDDPYLNHDAPDFTTTSQGGVPFHLSAQKGRKVLLTFYCGCDYCRRMAMALAAEQKEPEFKGVQTYAVTHMTNFRAMQFSTETGQKFTPINEMRQGDGHGIAEMYNSVVCPRVWYIGADGKVKYYSRERQDAGEVIRGLVATLKEG